MISSRALRAAALLLAFVLSEPAVARAAVFIVRHAEKQTESNDRDVPLSKEGQTRAGHLAAMLRDSGIVAIYSTDTVRTLATAEPLARMTGLKPILYDAAGPDAMKALAMRIRREHGAGNVLVVGHSNTIEPLVQAFGSGEHVPVGGAEYDGLWIVLPAAKGAPGLLRLRQ
jgi:phosphohistidine phosphatase SixA